MCLQTRALGLSSEWLRSCPATSARLPHFCLLPAALSTHSYSRKIPGSLNSSLPYWKQSEQEALVLHSSGRVWEGAQPWSAAVPARSMPSCGSGIQLPNPARAFGKPHSHISTSRLLLACWGVGSLDSKSFRVGACNLPRITSGKQWFPVAGHQIVSLLVKYSQSL